MDEKPLTTGQVGKICSVCPATVKRWVDTGLLPAHKLPGSNFRRITRAALNKFLNDNGMQDLISREITS